MTLDCSRIAKEIALASGFFVEGKEADVALLASDNNKKRSEKSVKQTSKLVDYCPKEDHHKTTNLETRNKQNGSKSTNHESQAVTFWTRASNHVFPKRSAKMIDGTGKTRNPSKRETTNFAITETKLFGKTYLIIASS